MGPAPAGSEHIDPPRRFDAEAESLFQSRECDRTREAHRLAVLSGIAVYAVSALVDIFLYPAVYPTLLAIRFSLFVPSAVVAVLVVHKRHSYVARTLSTSLLIFLAGVSLSIEAAIAPPPNDAALYPGLVIIFVFAYTIAKLPLSWATATSWSIILAYNLAHLIAGEMTLTTAVSNNVVFVAANLAGMVGNAAADRSARRDFMRCIELERKQTELAMVNAELSTQVNTHTREASRANQALAFLSTHDALTGLKNKRALQDDIRRILLTNQPFAIAYVDIDRFKSINDNLGHRSADEVIRQVAHRLRDRVRDHDSTARQGGDEFVILLAGADDEATILAIVERLLESIRRPISIPGQIVSVTASLGVALFPRDAADEEALLRCADSALYAAKEGGRNQARFFSVRLGETSTQRSRTERLLKTALERHEFSMNYQPKIDLATGALAGVEALLRWQSSDGPVSPAVFVPIAEEMGLMGEIGTWVLHTAIAEMNPVCRDLDDDFVLAINLSATQFADEELLGIIRGAIKASGINPSRLRFEIVESSLMHDVEQARSVMDGIRSLGSTISIDDFGTGYSSLAYLSRFPIDEIKIDQSFIRNFTDIAEDETIARSIVLLGHSLGLSV
ncbi:MAG TPA: EAL domain-containing protein, partial [Spirochaetia bacterium]|nr:EAL domain-containing protein [Spirochaetia bacterium]